jgi:glucose-6-phosphate dehydrogenase assembly protein OpcA
MGDPYEIWKRSVYAWLMCCKRTNMFNGRLTKDIALMITSFLLPDFSGYVSWSKRFKKARLSRLEISSYVCFGKRKPF